MFLSTAACDIMAETFDPLEFAQFIRCRWVAFAISGAIAVGLAFTVSVLLPPEYTARARILIQPARGSDPRVIAALRPSYLDSLRKYERVADSDAIFAQAMDSLGLRREGKSLPDKSRVLKVSKPQNQTVLEIRVTWRESRGAQALAQFIAEKTVEASRSLAADSARQVTSQLQPQLEMAQAKLRRARDALDRFTHGASIESLQSEFDSQSGLRKQVEADLMMARADLAALGTKQPAIQVRIAFLRQQQRGIVKTIARDGAALQEMKNRLDVLRDEQQSAQSAYEDAAAKFRAAALAAPFLGEHLEIIDHGAAPRSPGSPKLILNVIAAFFISMGATFVWLALRFGTDRVARPSSINARSLRSAA